MKRLNRYFTELKSKIKKNKKLYLLARGIKGGLTETRYQLLMGYYEPCQEFTTLIVNHLGEKNPDRMIYYLVTGEDAIATGGFGALLRWLLYGVGYAEQFSMTPVIRLGKHTHYYDSGMDEITDNVFEYYYEPASDISCRDVVNSKNVVHTAPNQFAFINNQFKTIPEAGYLPNEEEIAWLGEKYKKYFHLNKKTEMYLDQIGSFLGGKRTLGIHIRGTDFKMRAKGHPVLVDPGEFLKKAKELLNQGTYEQIFLATDDKDALNVFINGIDDERLLYYDDTYRSEGETGPHSTESDRPLHHYMLGLEILRDIYTLASCNGLIVGLSQVSFAARYVGYSLDKHYDDLIILNHGINEDGPVAKANLPLSDK